jgi:hypothetical protein
MCGAGGELVDIEGSCRRGGKEISRLGETSTSTSLSFGVSGLRRADNVYPRVAKSALCRIQNITKAS